MFNQNRFELHFTSNWAWYTMMTYLPTFINGMYKLSVSTSSLIALFPYLANTVIGIGVSSITDCFIKSGRYKYLITL